MESETLGVATIGERGRALYAEKIRPRLNEADKGKYVVINVETGAWIIGDDDLETSYRAARELGDSRICYMLRVGYRSADTFRPGLKLELDRW